MSPITHDEFHVSTGIVVNKADAISAVKMGKTALSCGYRCSLDWTPGVWMGVNYDCVQRSIKYEHVAIVDKGRAGDAARLRMDSVSTSYCIHVKEDTMAEMRTINLDGVDYKAEDAVLEALQGAKARADALQGNLDALSTEKSTLEAERDALKEKVDAVSKELADVQASKLDSTEVDNRVKARMALLDVANKAKVEKADSMDDKTLKVAVIKAVSPTANLDGKDENYISARFDLAVESLSAQKETEKKEDDAAKATRELNGDTAGTAPLSKVDEARARNHASYGKKPGKEE
jgi:hypothetical protein